MHTAGMPVNKWSVFWFSCEVVRDQHGDLQAICS